VIVILKEGVIHLGIKLIEKDKISKIYELNEHLDVTQQKNKQCEKTP